MWFFYFYGIINLYVQTLILTTEQSNHLAVIYSLHVFSIQVETVVGLLLKLKEWDYVKVRFR